MMWRPATTPMVLVPDMGRYSRMSRQGMGDIAVRPSLHVGRRPVTGAA
jgi:hypothetical protein